MKLACSQRAFIHLLAFSIVLTPGLLFSQTVTPAGIWSGTWNSPNGSGYSAIAKFTAAPDGAVEGSITWTLTETRRADLSPKIGQSGTEYVRGTFDAHCRVAVLAGYKLDDPQHILGMDHYQLILAPNGQGFGGVTGNDQGKGDTWTGMVSLRR